MKTLSRFALIGVIGGGAAACSSDASRLGDPFTNPFASNMASEPSATGSLPDEPSAPTVRTGRVQSEALGAPGVAMSPRPVPQASASAPAIQTSRVASTEAAGAASGMNPDAGRAMTARPVPAAAQPKLQFTPGPKAADKAAESTRREAESRKEAEARKLAEAKRIVEANKLAEAKRAADAKQLADAKKLAEIKKLVEAKRLVEEQARKDTAEAAKRRVRPGQTTAKVEEKPAKKVEAKIEAKTEAKVDPAKAKAEAARKVADAEAKLAKAEAAKDAAKKVAEAKAAEAAAKETAKSEKPAPTKVAAVAPATSAPVEPASTGSVDQSFRWPAKGRVISGYGSSGNEGINIAMPEGTAVKAAEDGTVAYAGSDVKGYGKLVLVRHTNGYVSAYAHNAELDVRPGEKVKRGQTIAKSGASGNVTSPQLHFEIRKGATPVDPMPHLASN